MACFTVQTSTTLWLYTTVEAETENEAIELAVEKPFKEWDQDYDLGACETYEILDKD